jgi:hypothetical protein
MLTFLDRSFCYQLHYALKSDLIKQCTKVETGTRVANFNGDITELTEAQAKDCE